MSHVQVTDENGGAVQVTDETVKDCVIVHDVHEITTTGDTAASPETFLGSACTGSDGDAGRVLTLSNLSLTKVGGFTVVKGGFVLYPSDYAVSHLASSSTVTFTSVKVYDSDEITVYYFT